MAYASGVDVGSTQTKAVIVNEDREIVGRALIDTGANVGKAAERAYDLAVKTSGLREDVNATLSLWSTSARWAAGLR